MNKGVTYGTIALLLVCALGLWVLKSKQSEPQPSKNIQAPAVNSTASRNNHYTELPKMSIDQNKQFTAVVTTDLGAFKIKLLAKDAPVTVNNFIFLAKEGFYNGISFHRIIKGFMIQTGDPLGTGTGGPGYKFADELPNKLSYGPGIVAMANAGPNTNGSQFFICEGEQSKNLNQSPNYTIFGQVIEGMDVVSSISNTPVTANSQGESSKPKQTITIKEIKIEEK